MNVNIIPFEGFDEGFGHSIGFRASDGGKTTDEAHILSKGNRLSGRVATPIVTEPFHCMGKLGCRAEAALNRFNHQIPHHLAGNAAGGSNMADDFTVTTVQGKSNSHYLAIPTGDLETIRAPAQVGAQGDDFSFMRQHPLLA